MCGRSNCNPTKTSLYVAFIHSIANEFNEINSSRLFCESSTQLFSISCFPTWFVKFHSLISPSHSSSLCFLISFTLDFVLVFILTHSSKTMGVEKRLRHSKKALFGCVIKFWMDWNRSSRVQSVGILFRSSGSNKHSSIELIVESLETQVVHSINIECLRGCCKIN